MTKPKGGPRPGAGRPPKSGVNRVSQRIQLTPSAWLLIDAQRQNGESRSDVIERLVTTTPHSIE